ncbi:MAG: FtsW/RodA/SpoVE family cell cycle protein [Epsilonproteobacteria bacterium]|nr:FtsW/RodA/SpoVE family cell cycle protein [Campylobacterota bacterium]
MADKWIYVIVSVLMAIGLVFAYSLPIYLENRFGWSEWHFFIRFLVFSILSLVIMYLLSQCNPDKCIGKIGWFLLIVGAVVIVLMPTPVLSGICPVIKGARRWIRVFGFSIAPVEFFKVGLIYFFAWSFSRKLLPQNFTTLKDELLAIFPYLGVLGITAIYVVIFQSDLGETLLILMIFFVMLIFTKVSPKTFGVLMIAAIVVFIVGITQKSYRLERVKSALYNIYLLLPKPIREWFSLDISTVDISYQIRQSINAIHNGGLLGVGIGNGSFKLGFLSDVHTDFVLAGIAEEIGFVGVFAVLLLIAALIWRILKIANRIEIKTHNDNIYKLFTVGVAILIGLETLLNIMGIIGLFPLKGLPIPFISYGGSSMLAFSIAIGMVLMISKKAKMN